MGLIREFKEFSLRGNAVDLAAGIIIGAAFNGVVRSLVDDIIMPPLGRLVGEVDFSDLFINLSGEEYESLAAAKEAGAATINYGLFVNQVISFLIVAFVVFLLVKKVNRLRRAPATEAPVVRVCPFCDSAVSQRATRCPACTSDLKS